jgi:hypothetical protein
MRHADRLPLLQPAQEPAGFNPRLGRERGRFDLPFQPHKRFVAFTHFVDDMSDSTFSRVAARRNNVYRRRDAG